MSNIKLFEQKQIRSVWNEEEKKWYFSVVDVIEALTDSEKPRDYWYRLKRREKEGSGFELSTFCRQLKVESSDGKKYQTECSDVEGLLRIIQSIPSPKAEPFKRWLAKVGYERLEEIENPELAQRQMKLTYKINTISPVRDGIFIERIITNINQSPVGTK
jgi:prophage antirepressor-like protein